MAQKKQPSVEDLQLWTPQQVASILGVSPRTLKAWRHENRGPRYVVLGERMVRYYPRDVQAYQAQLVTIDPLR